ncbi:PEP-CTERM sorting domain-containing protein [Paucibacter soli]|uniref:PEP-CTERM sorting domain-containing protein n=1 Tax=Paucibacter soli TaxID=3133433 RepID=UPI0030A8C04F
MSVHRTNVRTNGRRVRAPDASCVGKPNSSDPAFNNESSAMRIHPNFALAATMGAMTLASSGALAVTTYGDVVSPGVYFGSGNSNGNWTISTDSGIELALRAKNRETLATIDGSSGTYLADPGLCASCTGAPKAMWNYEFSVNSGNLSGLTYRLGIDHDPSAATNYAFVNPETYWADNAIAPGAFIGFQNSENVRFADTPGGIFNVNMPGLYSVTLEAWNGASLVNSTTMNVQVVPEPQTYALMLAGLAGLRLFARRRNNA